MSYALLDLTETLEGFTPCSIDPKNMGLAMKMFSSTYTRPVDAAIRELAINGLDSHVAAGNTDPIRISLPTPESPYLIVTDQGLGLGPEEVINVYGKYLSSTKLDNQVVIGEKGIGAKAPFAVADQFHVTAIKDGIKSSIIFAHQDNSAPSYKIVSTEETTEPNGLSIAVPVAMGNNHDTSYLAAAERVFFWWEPGTFFIEKFQAMTNFPCYRDTIVEYLSTDETMVLEVSDQLVPGPMMRMGSVGYEIPHSMTQRRERLGTGQQYVLNAPIKSYVISPAREGIEDNNTARDGVDTQLAQWKEAMRERHGQELDEATTSYDLFKSWQKIPYAVRVLLSDAWSNHTPFARYDLPQHVQLKHIAYLNVKARSSYSNGDDYFNEGDLRDLHRAFFVEMKDEITEKENRILQAWRKGKNRPIVYLVWEKEKFSPFVDPDDLQWLTFEELKDDTPKRARKVQLPHDIALEQITSHYPMSHTPFTTNSVKLSEIREMVDAGKTLIIGSRAEVEQAQYLYEKSFAEHVFITRGNRTEANTAKLIGRDYFTPEAYRAHTRSHKVAAMDDLTRLAMVNRAFIPDTIMQHLRFLRDDELAANPQVADALAPLLALRNIELDVYLAQDPQMPQPTLATQMPSVMSLFECSMAPNYDLILVLAQHDAKNASALAKKETARLARAERAAQKKQK